MILLRFPILSRRANKPPRKHEDRATEAFERAERDWSTSSITVIFTVRKVPKCIEGKYTERQRMQQEYSIPGIGRKGEKVKG